MLAGERRSYQGYQVALLPVDFIDVTQNPAPNSYSHCCGNATDFRFNDLTHPVYAPFDCHETSSYDSSAGRCFTSDSPVWTPAFGLTYVTVRFVHDAIPMAGTHFNQGDLIAHSGSANTGADHLHLDQANVANAVITNYHVSCRHGACYALNDSKLVSDIFYTTGNETVVNTTADGVTLLFLQWSQPSPPTPAPFDFKKYVLFGHRRLLLINAKRR